ncbi:carbohydrate ABC transporter permease [Actinomyces wuliandei]|uniref:carbohydrate ABC transporter permease n=1 Tax=Actinomyces wuliandei TaxID=2057743 RepID=UPI000FD7F701|nr:sugar ABC transporter permease [Actinomyces wuliandei]
MTATVTDAPARPRARRSRSKNARAQSRLAAILITPTILVLSVVIIFPVFQSIQQSFRGRAGLDPETGFVSDTEPFVGLDNYTSVFTSGGERFWPALYNTTLFGVVTVVLETILGVAMALIMHRAMRGRGIVRASILIPWAIPTAVSAILWGWIFNQEGVANAILGQHIMWASGDWSAKWAIIIADVWKTAPYIGLLTLAGLQVIPDEVYEAAKIDGASAWRRFTAITLPLVKPALVVAVLFRTLDALRMFDLPYILVGPRRSSVETLSMLVQDEASNLRYGSAAAYAVILFLYVFIIAFVFVRVLGADLGASTEPPRRSRGTRLPVSAFLPGWRSGRGRPPQDDAGAARRTLTTSTTTGRTA